MRTTGLVAWIIASLVLCSIPANTQLSWPFYDKTCPNELSTIEAAEKQQGDDDKRMGASLLRLHFHDCFLNGCDGWILLDDSAGPNTNSARGFDVKSCSGTVFYADIIEVVAQESVVVELGRSPWTQSKKSPPTSTLATLVSSCSAEGLSAKDMAALSEHEFDVFINHRGKDVKETVASLIFHKLQDKGLKVFFDKKSIPIGSNILEYIEQAIYQSSVHIVIFSHSYADSEWCLSELYLMSKTGAPIIPVFYGVRPSELRIEGEGIYSRAFKMHEQSGKFKKTTLQKWKKALCDVSYIEGIKFEGDQGELLERIASSVSECMKMRKFRSRL